MALKVNQDPRDQDVDTGGLQMNLNAENNRIWAKCFLHVERPVFQQPNNISPQVSEHLKKD